MTNFELAVAMMQLGAVTATALDSGGSTTMAFDGQLLSKPSDPAGERPVSDALLVVVHGRLRRAAAEPVLSPNDDGVAEVESLSYKVVRPSTVQASLVGPGTSTLPIDAGPRAPGSYRFTWTGSEPTARHREGTWRFTVTSTDDQGQMSSPTAPSRSTTRSRRSPFGRSADVRQEGNAPARNLQAPAAGEGHRDGRTAARERRARAHARAAGGGHAEPLVERPCRRRGSRVRRCYQVHVVAANTLGARRPVRPLLSPALGSRHVLLASVTGR